MMVVATDFLLVSQILAETLTLAMGMLDPPVHQCSTDGLSNPSGEAGSWTLACWQLSVHQVEGGCSCYWRVLWHSLQASRGPVLH